MADFPTREGAVESVRPGWKIVGTRPYVVSVTEPVDNPLPGQPNTRTVQRTQGTILSIQGPNGEPDEMTIGSQPGAQRGEPAQVTIVQGPGKAITGDQQSDPNAWQPVYSEPGNAKSTVIGQWDPKNNQFHPQAAGAGAKPTGTYTNVVDPNDPTSKRVIGMVDKGDNSWHAVSSDPNLPQRQIVTTPKAVYVFGPDSATPIQTIPVDQSSPFQAVIVDGKPFRFDPNSGQFTPGPVTEHPDIKDQNGLVMTWTDQADGGGKYAYPPGVSPPKTMTGAGNTSPYLIWYDATSGNEISRQQNPNYRPPQATLPAQNANAPMVPIEDPDKPGTIKWIPNEGRVMASKALSDLAASLSNTVVDPSNPLTTDDAKAIIDAANAKITADLNQATSARGAASDILSATTEGARTGAGLFQQRQQTATNLIQQGLGLAGQGQRSGNYGGGLQSALPGIGAQLVGGAAAYATELGGGQAVYDTAARLVKAADPQGGSPLAGQAYAALSQILERYQQSTGQPHPAVAATQAAQQSQASNGFTPPATPMPAVPLTPPPLATTYTPQYDPRFQPDWQQQIPGTLLPPGVAGTVPPGDPRFLGTQAQARTPAQLGFTAPDMFSQAGIGGMGYR